MRSPGSLLLLFISSNFIVTVTVLLLARAPPTSAGLGQLYSCIDWECEEWISKGKTLLRYIGKTDKHLSFMKNVDILIVSKPVDPKSPDWVGKIGNKIGLVPKDMIREEKMSKTFPKFKVELHDIPAWTRNFEEVEHEQVDDEAENNAVSAEEVEIEDIGENVVVSTEAQAELDKLDPIKLSSETVSIEQSTSEVPDQPIEAIPTTESPSVVPSVEIQTSEPSTEPTVELQPSEQSYVVDDVTEAQAEFDKSDPIQLSSEPVSIEQTTTNVPDQPIEATSTTESSPVLSSVEIQTPEPSTEPTEETQISEQSHVVDDTEPQAELDKFDPIKLSSEPVSIEEPVTKVPDQPIEATPTTESPSVMPSVEIQTPEPSTEPTEEKQTSEQSHVVDDTEPQAELDTFDPIKFSSEPVSIKEPVTKVPDLPIEATPTTESSSVLPSAEIQISEEPSTEPTEEKQTLEQSHVVDDTEAQAELDTSDPIKLSLEPVSVEQTTTEVPDQPTEATPTIDSPSVMPYDEIETSEPSAEPTEEKQTSEQSHVVDDIEAQAELDTSDPIKLSSEPVSIEETTTEVPDQSTEATPTTESPSVLPSAEIQISEEPPMMEPTEETQTSEQSHVVDVVPSPEVSQPDESAERDHGHDHASDDHHHHRHHHKHNLFRETNDSETSSLILVIKHISSTLLSFLPEPLQDTILDVDDALVLTGIIALTLVSICVPYFLIEGYMSVRPLKKKVVELNKSLWKVSAAYETQQEEFEIFKQKAMAHDEFKKRADQSENDVVILKKLETKHREQITTLKNQLKSQMKEAVDIRALIEKTLDAKKVVVEECEKYKTAYESTQESLKAARDELNSIHTQAKSSALLLNVSGKNVEVLNSKISMLEQEAVEMKARLVNESEKRKGVEADKQKVELEKSKIVKELTEFKNICHQYETTVSDLNDEIGKLESELVTIKETLGEDSPLLEVAEIQAKAAFAEREAESLRTRLDGLIADNDNLSGKLKEMSNGLDEARTEKEKTNNRLQVLEKYFKEREEEYIKTIEQLQMKESVRDKGKEELIKIIEEKESVVKDINERLEALKEEFEETKQQHRNEIRTLEAKGHENWLSLCQAERKAQDARKEAKMLRQRLTALSKERDDEDGDGLNGEVPMFSVLPDELVPLPILDEPPPYFGLGGDFVPPPPLPEGGEREPHRPPPLGGRLSPSFSDFDENVLSPIGVGRREDDTDGSSGSNSPIVAPPIRGGWINVPHNREGQGRESIASLSRATSSPIQPGANL